MALIRLLADCTEPPCHKCNGSFKPGSLKVKRPSLKPTGANAFSVGGKATVWVHEACSPTRTSRHTQKVKRK